MISPSTGTSRSERSGAGECSNSSPIHLRARGILFLHHEAADHQCVHAGTEKRAHRIGWNANDWLAAEIERCVHPHGLSRALPELVNQPPVERVHVALYGLG